MVKNLNQPIQSPESMIKLSLLTLV